MAANEKTSRRKASTTNNLGGKYGQDFHSYTIY